MKTVQNILVAFLLNLVFSVIELIGGLLTGSIAILADSLHDFGDALSIGLSFILEKKSHQKANNKYTYGYVRYSVLGSIITTVILLIGSLVVIIESIKRIINPVPLNYDGILYLAILGVAINLLACLYTKDGNSLNEKAVNLHMLEDVLGWVVVLIGAIIMRLTQIIYLDAVLSIGVALYIFYHAGCQVQKIMDLFFEKVPTDIDLAKLKQELMNIKGIIDIHHFHLRSIDGYHNFATMHVVCNRYSSKIKTEVRNILVQWHIEHSTIEIELKKETCANIDCNLTDNNTK